jgi:hypothetical protein
MTFAVLQNIVLMRARHVGEMGTAQKSPEPKQNRADFCYRAHDFNRSVTRCGSETKPISRRKEERPQEQRALARQISKMVHSQKVD